MTEVELCITILRMPTGLDSVRPACRWNWTATAARATPAPRSDSAPLTCYPLTQLLPVNVSLDRRRFLLGSGSLMTGLSVGCGRGTESVETAREQRPSIPLNILLAICGDRDQQAAIATAQRAWSAVSEQGLNISVIPFDRADPRSLDGQLVAAAARHDLLVFPVAWAADLMAAEAITPLADAWVNEMEAAVGGLPLALKNGAARWGDQTIGFPLGARLPAMLSIDEPPAPESWQAYDEIVSERWDGQASEPTAAGWAGAMFLWRAMAHRGWLFDPTSLEPLIAESHYVAALELFISTHNRYSLQRQTPTEIASAVAQGRLRGGIGWPQGDEPAPLSYANIPGLTQPDRILLDPFTPLVALSADCRQTAQAKRWLAWIVSGEGSELPRAAWLGRAAWPGRAATGLIRSAPADRPADRDVPQSDYAGWLTNRLNHPLTLPTLQLQLAGQYYQVLDHEIGRALNGEQSSTQALQTVADQWRAIADAVGPEVQLLNWRRAVR